MDIPYSFLSALRMASKRRTFTTVCRLTSFLWCVLNLADSDASVEGSFTLDGTAAVQYDSQRVTLAQIPFDALEIPGCVSRSRNTAQSA